MRALVDFNPPNPRSPPLRLVVLTFAAATALAGPVLAADYGAPPMLDPGGADYGTADYGAAAPAGWTGAYGGLSIGWIADAEFEGEVLGLRGAFDEEAVSFGAQLGYDHQIGSVVVGAVADVTYASLDADASGVLGTTAYTAGAEANWQGSLRARIGYAFDSLLIYGTGGIAAAKVDLSGRATDPDFGTALVSDDGTHVGYVVGAGAEYLLTANTSLGLEYLFTSYGDESYFGGALTDAAFETHQVRANFNVRF